MGTNPKYEPTPEEIQKMCLEIQETWNETETAKRKVKKDKEYEIPRYNIKAPIGSFED